MSIFYDTQLKKPSTINAHVPVNPYQVRFGTINIPLFFFLNLLETFFYFSNVLQIVIFLFYQGFSYHHGYFKNTNVLYIFQRQVYTNIHTL